jgi:hypothetical protein
LDQTSAQLKRLGAIQMKGRIAKFSRVSVGLLAVLGLAFVMSGSGIRAQGATGQPRASDNTGYGEDWGQKHLVFSNPGTEEDAIQNGRYDDWLKIVNDPRYILQQRLRNSGARPLIDGGEAVPAELDTARGIESPFKEKKAKLTKDWSEGVGAGTVYPSTTGGVPVYPLKWNFSTASASCSADYVIFPTGVAGSATKATLIAYYELYSNCTGSPTVSWAYNTAFAPESAGGAANSAAVLTAPTFSLDGTQIAFIQIAASKAYLVLLRVQQTPPGTGTLASPATPMNETAANYENSCTVPCMTIIALSGATTPNDAWSNPWIDYADDVLYVGDSVGKLHKFFPLFNGTVSSPPAEITTTWPVTLTAANQVSSPVYDPVSGKVFVGDTGGLLYSVTTAGTVAKTASLGGCQGINDAPIVDGTAGSVYAFVQDYHTTGTNYFNAIFQYTISTFPPGTTPTPARVGNGDEDSEGMSACGGGYSYFYAGALDNIYYNSTSATSPTGNLYVVGDSYGPSILYKVAITSGTMATGTIAAGRTVAQTDAYGYGTNVTEFCNSGTGSCATGTTGCASGFSTCTTSPSNDYIFFSVFEGEPTGCTATAMTANGCILSYNVSGRTAFTTGLAPGGALNVKTASGTNQPQFATGGFIIDNAATTTGASNIYFLTTDSTGTCTSGTGLCAIQVEQAAP